MNFFFSRQVALPLDYVENVPQTAVQHDFGVDAAILQKCKSELEKLLRERAADDRILSTGQVDLTDPVNNPSKSVRFSLDARRMLTMI